MKKVILSFAIVLSSFFIFNFKVKASELSLDISFDNINEEFLKVKSSAEELMTQYNKQEFVIVKKDMYYVYFFDDSFESATCSISNSKVSCWIYHSQSKFKYYNDVLSSAGTSSSNFGSYDYSDFSNILYATFTFILKDSSNTLNLNYANTSLQVNNLDTIPLVYDLYLKSSEVSDPHKDEKQVLESFYSLCIEKLKYLAEVFVSNYVYLAIIVIFIIIFIFKLINRRFL